jgi:hypothetical protein
MDWSKAKTILIIVLLAICLWLSGTLVYREVLENKETARAAIYVREYLETQGASYIADIPLDRPSLPVIFLEMQETGKAEPLTSFSGFKVCYSGSGLVPVLEKAGKNKAKVGTASSALMMVAGNLTEREQGDPEKSLPSEADFSVSNPVKGLEINSITLVYYVDFSGGSAGSKDTAIPSWRIETNRGTFYINAF